MNFQRTYSFISAVLLTFIFSSIMAADSKEKSSTISCDNEKHNVYHCQDGSCIKRLEFCDGKDTCPDGSDELSNTTQMDGILCKYRRRITIQKECILPNKYKCDHEIDCVGGRDECGCDNTFQCDNGDCVLKVSFCDSLPPQWGCSDGSDEREFDRKSPKGFQCPVTRTHLTKVCALPLQYVCDGDSDCDFGIDECFCNFTAGEKKGEPLNDVFSNENCFRCLDRSFVIPNIHVCDGVVHCGDLSDECSCPETEWYKRPEICKSICEGHDCDCPGQIECMPRVDNYTQGSTHEPTEKICVERACICDHLTDCQDKLDEAFCPSNELTFQCYDGSKIIQQHKACNGPIDCPDGSDELYCHDEHDYFCEEYRVYFPKVEDWDDKNETRAKVQIPPGVTLGFDRPFFTHKCDGIAMCEELDDECNQNCTNEPEYCKHVTRGFRCPNSGSLIIGVEICDGKPTCNDTHPADSADEFGCPGRFYCENKGSTRLPIHIPIEARCDGKSECDDMSDEMNCNASTHFYCNDGGSTQFIPMSRVCDGRADCKEGGDECQNCNPSPFSSDKRLISSRVLIYFLWIIGILAVFGNLATIAYQAWNLAFPAGTPSAVATTNRILVLNLSTADSLVGIYLVGLGIKDASVTEYCVLDQEWRSSVTCSALGSLALIGTETSVFILSIMTAYRLYLVVRPFEAQKLRIVIICIVVAWLMSLVLAFAPLANTAQDYFVSCVWFRNHQFIGEVCRNDLQKFTEDLTLLNGTVTTERYSWSSMFAVMERLNSSYVPERYFGYYSAHSVCLPRLFPDPENDAVWGYSLFLILINFFAFVFILISYIIIYRTIKIIPNDVVCSPYALLLFLCLRTTTRRKVKKSKSEERAILMQRKVTRLVLTDFCCWMPICVMAFMKVGGVNISDVAYAVTAIILLPINSAMNPFLYSDVLDILWEKIKPSSAVLKGMEERISMIAERSRWRKKTSTPAEKASYSTRSTGLTTRTSISSPETRHSSGSRGNTLQSKSGSFNCPIPELETGI